jgi:hypothetical protein
MWLTPVITVVRRLRQEDGEFQVSFGYIARHCLKQNKRNQNFAILPGMSAFVLTQVAVTPHHLLTFWVR